jgi:hypothetical protein
VLEAQHRLLKAHHEREEAKRGGRRVIGRQRSVDGRSSSTPLPHRRMTLPDAPGWESGFLFACEGVDGYKTGAEPADYLYICPKHEMLWERRMPMGWEPGRLGCLDA